MSDDKVIYMVQKSKIQPEDLETVELALREAQSQYLQLIDELPAGYTEFDLKGNLVSFNQSTLDMSFRTKDELMNLGFKEYIESETAAEVYRTYNSVYRSGIPKKGFIHEIIRKDGTKITLECAISLKKINGKVVGFRGIWQDISARKKTEEDLANHRSRLEALKRA